MATENAEEIIQADEGQKKTETLIGKKIEPIQYSKDSDKFPERRTSLNKTKERLFDPYDSEHEEGVKCGSSPK